MTLLNFNNLLMNGNGCFGNGVNSMLGLGNVGGFNYNSIFMDCNGSFNYDKLAGYSVANALGGVLMSAIAENKKSRTPEVNIGQEAAKLSDQIKSKKDTLSNLTTEKGDLTAKKSGAESKIRELSASKRNDISSLEIDLERAKSTYEADASIEHKAALDAAEKALNDAKAHNEKVEKEIKAQQDIIVNADKKIKELDEKITSLESEISELEDQYEEYSAKLKQKNDNEILDKADGNFIQRELGGEKGDTRSALRTFRKLKEKYDANPSDELKAELKAAASKFKGCYYSLSDDDKKTFTSAYNIVCEWDKSN